MGQRGDKQTVHLLLALFLLVGLSLYAPARLRAQEEGGQEVQRSRLQLNRVIKQLMTEKEALSKTRGEEQGLLVDLETIDRKLSDTEKRLAFLARQREKAKNELPHLAEQIRLGHIRVGEMRRQLKSHLRLMYGLGGQGVVKVALSQKDSARVRQSVLYYGRLIQSRNARFKEFQDSIQELDRIVLEHKTLAEKVEALSSELLAEREEELMRRQQRVLLLDNILREKEYRKQKVKELNMARSTLTSFMQGLAGALAKGLDRELEEERAREVLAIPAPTAVPRPIVTTRLQSGGAYSRPAPRVVDLPNREEKILQVKGRLPLPVSASGQSRKPSPFFRIAENSPVKAIHRAQVVYADWFRGYGQLIILNHGEEIYSLYGHNRELLVTPGDWVEANQVIAHTGDTGSLEGVSGLYFEIRRKGQAENPRGWLVSSR